MSDGSFPTLISKDRDSNATANPIFVQLTDGTDLATITAGGALNVAVNGTVTVTATDLDIRDLTHVSDSVKIGDGTDFLAITAGGEAEIITNFEYAEDSVHSSGHVGAFVLSVRNDAGTALAADGDYIPLTTNSTGALYVALASSSFPNKIDDSAFSIGVDSVSPSGFLADETAPDSVDEGDVGLARMTLDRKILTRIVGASDANRLDIDASGHAQIDIAAISVTAFPVSATTALNTALNPIYVQVVNTGLLTNEVHNYNTSASVASDGTSNHDYTVTGTTFLLKSVIFAASGNIKVEIQTGPVASLTTKAVGFLNGRQGDTRQLFFDPPIEVPVTSTGTVRVIRTNRQGTSMDVYSTIIGNDIA